MAIRPARDMTVTVLENGCLELYSAWAGESYRYAPATAAMWIALQQNAGRADLAVETLAALWGVDPIWIRFELDAWLGEMKAAGLMFSDEA